MKILIVHKKDGYDIFEKEKFEKYKDRFIKELQRFHDAGFPLMISDIVTIYEDPNDEFNDCTGDSVFYTIVQRYVSYHKNEIHIIYILNDE